MPTTQTYNPVKIRVKEDDLTLVQPDGRDEVFATPEDALAYLDKALDPDGDVPYVRGKATSKRTKFVLIPAAVA